MSAAGTAATADAEELEAEDEKLFSLLQLTIDHLITPIQHWYLGFVGCGKGKFSL